MSRITASPKITRMHNFPPLYFLQLNFVMQTVSKAVGKNQPLANTHSTVPLNIPFPGPTIILALNLYSTLKSGKLIVGLGIDSCAVKTRATLTLVSRRLTLDLKLQCFSFGHKFLPSESVFLGNGPASTSITDISEKAIGANKRPLEGINYRRFCVFLALALK